MAKKDERDRGDANEPRGKTVLVVEDSELSRAVISRLLRKEGWSVLAAGDGAEGAVLALGELPDVVVTDIEMPVMDGYQLARLLKSDPATAHIALLILTSHGDASSRFWGLETGADAFLLKDDLEAQLPAVVEDLFVSSRAPATAAHEAPKTPLEALARVSRHLDARLLEAVLINRILEHGVRVETVSDAAAAILDTLSQIVDARLMGLAVDESESLKVFLRLADDTARDSASAVVRRIEAELGSPSDVRREVAVDGGKKQGKPLAAECLSLVPLPLRNAAAVLAVAPTEADYDESREQLLLERVGRQLALVIDNARLAERLRELSMRDDLTGLLNRRTIRQRLGEEVQRAHRYGHPLSVALCDLDHFKRINDTFGHQAGDQVLIAISGILDQQARMPDVAGRYGGEEFLVVLPETDLANACSAARRLRETIESSRIVLGDGQVLPITGSLGVAALSEIQAASEGAVDDLLALADQRLYAAKAAGRNKVVP